jgi:thiamine pyrophosphokinase
MTKLTIYIFCNGNFNNKEFYKKVLSENSGAIIIGADGGNNFLDYINIKPNYVVGDFDSISPTLLDFYKKNNDIEIIYKDSQDITDLQLAIKVAQKLKPQKIVILGAIGDRFDHTLVNAIILGEIDEKIDASIVDENNEIRLVKSKIILQGKIGDTISIIPITKVKGLTYSGLKWPVKDLDVETGWIGISNEFAEEIAEINLEDGMAFVVRQNN